MTTTHIDHAATVPAGAAPVSPPVVERMSTSWGRLLTASAARVLVVSIAGLLFWTVAPAVMGWHPTTVMTGSMEPRISPGDVVVARPVVDSPVVLDQILLVDDPDHAGRMRLHRLVGIQDDGKLQLRGDANANPDSTPVDRSAVHGVSVLRIPFIGSPVVWLAERDWTALLLLVGGAALLLYLTGVDGNALWSRRSVDTPRRPAAPTGAERPRRSVSVTVPRWLRSRAVLSGGTVVVLVVIGFVLGSTSGAVWTASAQQQSSTTSSAQYFTCASAVAATTPSQSYRFDEPSGTTAADSSGNNRPGTYRSAPTFGAIGPCPRDPGNAVTFDGAAEYVSTANAITNPTTYSTEIWFRTTTTRGGFLIGLGSTATGASATVDRVVYLRNDGKLSFGTSTGTATVLTSAAAYNDGQWHHVVATQSAAGMRLFVDAVQVGTNAVTTARSMTGYWRIGYNALAAFPSPPTSNFLAGTVAVAAIYPTALTAAQVSSHFLAAEDYTSCRESVQAAGPAEFYRLSESGGTLAQDWSTTGRDGTYQGSVTFGAAGPCGATTGVTLDGSTEYVSTAALFTAPTTYSLEAWFRTSGTKGGMIIGFGNTATGAATQADRMMYLTDAGQVIFGVYPGAFQVARSATGLNNGAWHHVVATQSSVGMRLYVDGVLVGSNVTTTAQNYNGYWRVGYNPLTTWESAPASPYFAGSLINAAVYSTALTATQVAAHYDARTATGN